MTSRRDFLKSLVAGAAGFTVFGGLLSGEDARTVPAHHTKGRCILLEPGGNDFTYVTAIEVGRDGTACDTLLVEDHALVDFWAHDQNDRTLRFALEVQDSGLTNRLMYFDINRRWSFRWVAAPGNAMVFENRKLDFVVERATPGSVVAVQAVFLKNGARSYEHLGGMDDDEVKMWEDYDDDVEVDDE